MDTFTFHNSTYELSRDEICSFRNKNRQEKRNREYFDWRYLYRPNQNTAPIIIWAVNDRNQKIGMLSLIMHSYFILDKEYLIGLLGDISVDLNYRGMGIANKMLEYLSSLDEFKKCNIAIVLPNKAVEKALYKSGWDNITEVNRYVKILSPRSWHLKNFSVISRYKLLYFFGSKLITSVSLERLISTNRYYTYTISNNVEQDIGEVWKSTYKKDKIIANRNSDYLYWRYCLHPVTEYKIFHVRYKKKIIGYIIFHWSQKRIKIDDVLCLQDVRKYKYQVMKLFLEHAKQNNAESISIRINDFEVNHIPWLLFGFIKRSDKRRIMIFDNTHDAARNKLLYMKNSWYFTAGDKDA